MVPGLVSVIIPAFRADAYLAGALEGVQRQRYSNWEAIVVEDGSAGATESLVRQFADGAPTRRAVYARHDENRGPSATRNTGIEHAQGEYLAFLDADDRWIDTHLAAAVGALEDTGGDIAYSSCVMAEDGSGFLRGIWGPSRDELAAFPRWLVRRNYIVPSATVLRRRVIEVVGGFDAGLRYCEDLDLWLRCLASGLEFVHVGGCHCIYRKGAPEAATNHVLRIVEAQAQVLERHFPLSPIPKAEWRRQLAFYRLAAGALHLENDRRRASRYFLKAWQTRPERLDLLCLAGLASWVFPFLPVAGAVRRLKKMRGYG